MSDAAEVRVTNELSPHIEQAQGQRMVYIIQCNHELDLTREMGIERRGGGRERNCFPRKIRPTANIFFSTLHNCTHKSIPHVLKAAS